MRILIVDDSEDGRDVAEAMLLSAGYREVATASSAAEAFAMLAIDESTPTAASPTADLVLLDIVMPDMDGIEACARIRKDPRYADLPIIMVTLLGDMGSLANAFVAGATDYINKPVNRIELLARVRSAIKIKSELDRRQARERQLIEFVSTWGDRRATNWIDDATGLFVGEVAEAYLIAAGNHSADGDCSVIALAIDRLDAYRTALGEEAVTGVMAQVGRSVRALAATVGVVAATYGNGMIVLIAPDLSSKAALELGEVLRSSIARLAIDNPESIGTNGVTTSVAVVSGRVKCGIDRVQLLTRAISFAPKISAAGGDRVVSESV